LQLEADEVRSPVVRSLRASGVRQLKASPRVRVMQTAPPSRDTTIVVHFPSGRPPDGHALMIPTPIAC